MVSYCVVWFIPQWCVSCCSVTAMQQKLYTEVLFLEILQCLIIHTEVLHVLRGRWWLVMFLCMIDGGAIISIALHTVLSIISVCCGWHCWMFCMVLCERVQIAVPVVSGGYCNIWLIISNYHITEICLVMSQERALCENCSQINLLGHHLCTVRSHSLTQPALVGRGLGVLPGWQLTNTQHTWWSQRESSTLSSQPGSSTWGFPHCLLCWMLCQDCTGVLQGHNGSLLWWRGLFCAFYEVNAGLLFELL